MRIRLPKRRLWRVLIYLVCFMLIVLAIDLVLVQAGRRITPGYATTRITGPTIPGGPIDYLTALESRYNQGVTPANNAVVLLLEALGPTYAGANNQSHDGIAKRLGMPPLPATGDYLQHRDKFPADPEKNPDEAENDIQPLVEGPWRASERPQAAAWVKANEKPLAKAVEAS